MILKLFLILALPVSGQHIVWEKVFGSVTISDDELGSIYPLENGDFLSTGISSGIGGYINLNGTYDGVILMRFDENGDTVFARKANILGYTTPFLQPKYGGLYRTVIDARIPVGNDVMVCPAIIEFTDQGFIYQTHILNQLPNWQAQNAIQTDDFGLIISGTFIGGLTSPTNMMSIKVNFLGEVEWSNQWFPPASVRGIGNRLFNTGSNQFLITGTLGRRIGGFTFDSLGIQTATKVFYETPSMRQFITGEATPSIGKSVICAGYYKNGQNEGIGFFGKFDSLGARVWGGERNVIFDYPQSNTDGSVWATFYHKDSLYVSLKKFGPDSSLLKSIPIFLTGGYESIWRQYLPIGNNQVIAVGYRNTQQSSRQFLITKIDSFGVPVTAVQNVLVKPPASYPTIQAFPNPASSSVQFSNLDKKSLLSFYSLTGKKELEKTMLPNESVSVESLPSGIYLYRIKMGDQLFSGRFVKE
jgi:Secretion system C-terminal sorting domain